MTTSELSQFLVIVRLLRVEIERLMLEITELRDDIKRLEML